jgi:hypothetical protein
LVEHPAGSELGEEMRPFEVDPDQFVEALLSGFHHVGANALGDAGIVDEQIKTAEFLAAEIDEAEAVLTLRDIALKNGTAGFGLQRLSRVEASLVGGDNVVSPGQARSPTNTVGVFTTPRTSPD